MNFLLHQVIEAGLAVELCSTIADIEGDRAAVLAFEIGELVAVEIAKFLAVSELNFHALLAEEILRIHVFAKGPIEIVLAAIVDSAALEAIVQCHVVHHVMEGIRPLLLCESRSQSILVENLECGLTGLLFFGLAGGEQGFQLLWRLLWVQFKFFLADGAVQVLHGDATGLLISDPSIDALCMENVSAREPDAGLRAELVDVAEAAKVGLQAIDEGALLLKAWLWHIDHVLGLDDLRLWLAARIHARDALGLALDPTAGLAAALVDLPAELILSPVVAEARDDLALWLLHVDDWVVYWYSVASKVIYWIADDNVIFDHLCFILKF